MVRGHLAKIQEIDSPQKFTLATSLIQTGVEHDTIQIFNCGGLFMRENRDILFKFVTTVPVHSIFWWKSNLFVFPFLLCNHNPLIVGLRAGGYMELLFGFWHFKAISNFVNFLIFDCVCGLGIWFEYYENLNFVLSHFKLKSFDV